jgi:protein TonB
LRQEGRVLLNVAVSADGRATTVSVVRSSGVAALDQSAEATVRRWSFEPARVAGVAVASQVEVPVAFKLSD